jgi:hypothetical protein
VATDHTIFSVEDSDDEIEATALESAKSDRTDHNVRFQEEVQVIGPSLRSTLARREAGVYVSYSLCSFLCPDSRLPFFLLRI